MSEFINYIWNMPLIAFVGVLFALFGLPSIFALLWWVVWLKPAEDEFKRRRKEMFNRRPKRRIGL